MCTQSGRAKTEPRGNSCCLNSVIVNQEQMSLDFFEWIEQVRLRCFLRSIIALIAIQYGVNCAIAQAHFSFAERTGNNATIALPANANPNIAGIPLAIGDEIGAFAPGGLCVGAIVWTASNSAITVWGDNEQTPGIDGIRVGEAISYRAWRKSTNTEFSNVSVTYSMGDGIYQVNGLYALSSLAASPGLAANGDETKQIPTQFILEQNYPNPFNPSTMIRYELAKEGKVLLEAYDLVGHRVATLVDQEQAAGTYEVVLRASALSSGFYLCVLRQGEYRATRKFMLLR
jgi:hypothetical protein